METRARSCCFCWLLKLILVSPKQNLVAGGGDRTWDTCWMCTRALCQPSVLPGG